MGWQSATNSITMPWVPGQKCACSVSWLLWRALQCRSKTSVQGKLPCISQGLPFLPDADCNETWFTNYFWSNHQSCENHVMKIMFLIQGSLRENAVHPFNWSLNNQCLLTSNTLLLPINHELINRIATYDHLCFKYPPLASTNCWKEIYSEHSYKVDNCWLLTSWYWFDIGWFCSGELVAYRMI